MDGKKRSQLANQVVERPLDGRGHLLEKVSPAFGPVGPVGWAGRPRYVGLSSDLRRLGDLNPLIVSRFTI